jgi:hypothetical protein
MGKKQPCPFLGKIFRFFVPKQQVLLCLNQKSCYLENTSKLKPGALKAASKAPALFSVDLKHTNNQRRV